MERDERLEELSDKVRKGEPIGFTEAIEVIEYQNARKSLKSLKKPGFFSRLFKRNRKRKE